MTDISSMLRRAASIPARATRTARASAGALAIAVCAGHALAAPVITADARLTRSLEMLDPTQRFQQICDVAAMKVIRQKEHGLRPDRAILDAISSVRENGNTLSGKGGAIRVKGGWRQIAFTCVAAPDRLSVLDFSYRLGDHIPEEDWEKYSLWR